MKRSVIAVLVCAVAFGACMDDQPTAPRVLSDAALELDDAPGQQWLGRDAMFAQMARMVPGFGGLFYDEAGNLNVVVAPRPGEPRPSGLELASRLGGVLPAIGISTADLHGAIVLEGNHDFAQLHEWHQRIVPVLGLPGAVVTAIDESRNVLRVGIEPGISWEGAEQLIERLGVPGEAVEFFEAPPVELALTLRDFVRPVAGGLQIVWPGQTPGSWFVCSLGFNIREPDMQQRFVTASHCSTVRGDLTNTPYFQPLPPVLGGPEDAFIGPEVIDLPFFTSATQPLCPAGRVCRWSDVLVAEYEIPAGDIAFGRVMQPTAGSFALPTHPTRDPHMRVVGELAFPVLGQRLFKIGRTTGLTGGDVVLTCANSNVAGSIITMLCQDWVQGVVAGGDSGSPVVFAGAHPSGLPKPNSRVDLAGVLWGSSGFAGGSFVMGAMANIRFEFPGAWSTN